MVCFYFPNWQKLLPPKLMNLFAVCDNVFSSIGKFVLTIFDLKDFERIFNLEMLIDSYTKFCHSLRQLEPDRGALIAIAEGTINTSSAGSQGLPWEYDIHPIAVDGIELHLMELALEEMRKYVPLKGHRKMLLMLEFVRDKKPHVLDTLSLEA
ncbi:hypothetical protein RHMOL_Rhmol04G0325700 [Rhododendron molle]|uniref:Uncharacterized protein n=1 Tax=Rhododendron molle TaxID=49168 RepID=A0ACC0P7Y5_RHOML|nr:hypothetical protein RHMOL_Rhmol04G0325700 [Rhododendron molle]